MVGLLVVAVAIAMVMVISLLLVRRKPYGTISHGIVEVRIHLKCWGLKCSFMYLCFFIILKFYFIYITFTFVYFCWCDLHSGYSFVQFVCSLLIKHTFCHANTKKMGYRNTCAFEPWNMSCCCSKTHRICVIYPHHHGQLSAAVLHSDI